jgi:LysR family hydrogen peroxide-inducible transcriptional activator
LRGAFGEPPMEMHQIRYFLAVCETLNFTRAAEKCGVSQPALTRAIRTLEEELGGLLLRREGKLTHLTDLGQLMRPHLEEILQETQAVKAEADSFLEAENAPLSLGVMCTIGPLRFVGFLARFRRQNPEIEVSVLEQVPRELTELLLAGRLDVAVLAQPDPFPERFEIVPLYEERFMVACPPGHRFEAQEAVRVAELDGESYLSRLDCEFYDYLRELRLAHGVRFVDAYRSRREEWIQTMVMAGLGICFIPEFSPVMPGIKLRPLVEPTVTRQVSLATVADRRRPAAVDAFVGAIRAYRWPNERAELAA